MPPLPGQSGVTISREDAFMSEEKGWWEAEDSPEEEARQIADLAEEHGRKDVIDRSVSFLTSIHWDTVPSWEAVRRFAMAVIVMAAFVWAF